MCLLGPQTPERESYEQQEDLAPTLSRGQASLISAPVSLPRTHSEQEEAGGLIGPKEGEDTGAKEESVRGDQ